MTTLLAFSLYGLLVLTYAILAIFIIYHFYQFTLNPAKATFLVTVFTVITVVLFLVNIGFFVTVDFSALVPDISINNGEISTF